MAKSISAWWSAKKPTRRRLIQVYAALLYNANLKGFIEGEIYTGPTKNVCVPGFNCYSCPGAVGACPLGALQNSLASSSNRAPYYVLGILLLFALTLGRTICGWICPLGLIQELFYKIPTPKIKKSRFTRVLSWLKYVVLIVFVVIIPLAYAAERFPVPAFCKYICPAGTFEGAMGLLANPVNAGKFSMLGILFTRKFIIMVVIFTACIFVFRAFCRFLCPLGAIYALCGRLSLLGVRVDPAKCTNCGKCVAHCKMDIKRVADHECIHCASCVDVCPTKAISLKCGKITLIENEGTANGKKRKGKAAIAWIAALLVLVGILWFYNRPTIEPSEISVTDDPQPIVSVVADEKTDGEEAAVQNPADEEIPVGSEVGMRCPDFTVSLYGSDGNSLTYQTGKVTVINFWATWCTPCVGELPYFQQIFDKYGDEIELVAIHSNLVTDDVDKFLAKEGYTLPFALDATGSVIQSLGGSTMLPMTVIVDKTGVISYNKVGSVTYALLESLIEPLL